MAAISTISSALLDQDAFFQAHGVKARYRALYVRSYCAFLSKSIGRVEIKSESIDILYHKARFRAFFKDGVAKFYDPYLNQHYQGRLKNDILNSKSFKALRERRCIEFKPGGEAEKQYCQLTGRQVPAPAAPAAPAAQPAAQPADPVAPAVPEIAEPVVLAVPEMAEPVAPAPGSPIPADALLASPGGSPATSPAPSLPVTPQKTPQRIPLRDLAGSQFRDLAGSPLGGLFEEEEMEEFERQLPSAAEMLAGQLTPVPLETHSSILVPALTVGIAILGAALLSARKFSVGSLLGTPDASVVTQGKAKKIVELSGAIELVMLAVGKVWPLRSPSKSDPEMLAFFNLLMKS